MKRTYCLLFAVLLLTGCADYESHEADADHSPHWSYDQAAEWGSLDPAFAACTAGTRQSPIDLAAAADTDLPDLTFAYSPGTLQVEFNGHTIHGSPESGGSFSVGERAYDLVQFHVHTPSEHTVGGQSYPLELHLVHADSTGALAVVGILFTAGEAHPVLDALTTVSAEETSMSVAGPIDATDLLPEARTYYAYDGSLTTPPCSEGVAWHVMSEPVTASPDQIAEIVAVIGTSNRPVQPGHDRALRLGE